MQEPEPEPRRTSQEEAEAPEPGASTVYQEIAEELRRAGYVGVTPAVVARVHRQVQEGKPQGDVLGRAIMAELQSRW